MHIKVALQPKQSDVEAFQAGLLMLAKDLPEIKQIKDIGKAALAYAKAKGLSKEIQDEAGVLIIEAGIEFSKMKKAGQEAGEIKTQATAKSSSIKELDNFGVKKKESYINDQLAKDESVTLKIIDSLNESIKIRMIAWKELMRYSFAQKSSLQGELNHHHNVKTKVYVVPCFSDNNVDSSEHHISK